MPEEEAKSPLIASGDDPGVHDLAFHDRVIHDLGEGDLGERGAAAAVGNHDQLDQPAPDVEAHGSPRASEQCHSPALLC